MSDNSKKFADPFRTANGENRAFVDLQELKTLWFNTGTLCNISCVNCYIESSPKNDRLVYLSLDEVVGYLDEVEKLGEPTCEIGFTGGEPFMNPYFLDMLDACLSRGFSTLTLTNAMKPLLNKRMEITRLKDAYGPNRLVFRVSIDHYDKSIHELERGIGAWAPMIEGLNWLRTNDLPIKIAGRKVANETAKESRLGYSNLFKKLQLKIDAFDDNDLVIFPEMDASLDVPEITSACWDILSVQPQNQMCASSRMILKRKGEKAPCVVACTLLPYEPEFELGRCLSEARAKVYLNHPHCSKFCVLGGASCS
tara:strand:+ start:4106 stop:5035 length:930 start_codon:yes stop_codon:yes gene_type:complete